MKHFPLCILLAIFLVANTEEVTKEKDCKCWEGLKAEKHELGSYYCTSEKTRNFGCNEEKPPICKCEVDGKEKSLDLGATDCLSVDLQNGRWCKNKEEFIEYFKKYPQYAIYD